jgi:DNA topoisomerase VI subunit B
MTAAKIIRQAGKNLSDRSYPRHIAHAQATALHKAIQKTRILAPRTDCIVPIGERPILEIIIRQLVRQGLGDIILSVGHLGELIEAYFQNGHRFSKR